MATTTKFPYPVHPAAGVFPMMADVELDALAKDIAARGLLDKIVLWRSGPEPDATIYLLDGRNRLAALERLGRPIEPHTIVRSTDDVPEPASYVIARNIRRRHLTKEQQAELIVKATEAAHTDSANVARSVPRDEQGRVQGSTKDPVLAAAVEEGQKHGISKRTVQNARAKVKAETEPARRPMPPGLRKRLRPVRAVITTKPASPPADDAVSPGPFELVARYQCPECDTVLDEGERRCSDCNKFGRRIEGIVCPKCSEFVSEDEL